MNFHHLAYWQDKALSLAIENRLFINGEYTAAAENETFETVDPVTQAPLANIARGKSVDIDRAVSAARGVFERGDWSLSSPAKRKAVLNKLADLIEANAEELALLETLDTGKPIRHSLRDDIPGAARAIRWYAEAIDKVYGEVATTSSHELAMIVREPVGVIAAIVPWNFPLLLTCWKLGPALAAGNSVVLKPSEKSPLSAIRLAGLAKEAGLPDGVLNVVTGFGHEAGQALSRHNDIDAIAFTGSTRTGKQLLKDAGDSNMKRVWLEAGGKSANIVFADCPDLQQAASATAAGIFYNQGQVCIAGTRLLLEESIADEFLALLKQQAQNWQPGHPLDPATTMGTLIDCAHADSVHSFIQEGESKGQLLLDGRNAGLSSALHLAEAGFDVVVLEASRIGFGASGRNGGQLVNSYSRDIDVIEKSYGMDTARMLGSMMFEGGEIIRERIKRYQIDCDYRPGGLFVAMNDKQLATLEEQKENWERYGNKQLEMLDANAIRREVASDRYTGALLDHSGGHIHPLNLAIGEADAIRLNGGRVYELSAVTQIQHTTPAVVRTATGQVTAKYVIVAGNAYLGDKVEPELAKRSMPCGTQVITTERLSDDLARSLIPKNYCVEDCNYLLDYYRLTADNRLLYGGGVVYGARDPDDVERLVVPKLLKTFPQLKGVKIDYRWTGNFLLTLSRMPQFGRLDTNIYYMQGYSGHGVTCTHLAGRLIAELLRGDAERFDAFANLPHYPFPGGRTLRVPFTAMGAAYYSLRDRLGV
ncbi:aldehyde dehydrogenase family protein [Escherichia coli]|nr:aldehyde dehydrogenase family protein [Escherichia coli]